MAERLRLAELLAPLSYVTDLGMGEPDGQALRSTMLAVRLGDLLGLPAADLADCYYTTLLRHIGCTATAHEESAALVPDEIALRAHLVTTDTTRPGESIAMARRMLARLPARDWPGLLMRLMSKDMDRTVKRSVCEVAAQTSRRLGLGPAVAQGLYQVSERWDGRGQPAGLSADAITIAARVALTCSQLASLSTLLGPRAAGSVLRERAGGWLDPDLAGPLAEHGVALLHEIDTLDLLVEVPAAEPHPPRTVAADTVDDVTRIFGDLVDLKTPWSHGHSSAVAEMAGRAAAGYGIRGDEQTALRRAALLHDLGRVGVPNSVWEKAGPLTATDWERVRLYPYHTERILARCPALAPAARTAGMHHERCDSSGYHRQLAGSAIPPAARLLAAADVYQALLEPRPYRDAFPPAAAVTELRRMGAAGHLEPQAVRAVCDAAGGGPSTVRPGDWPDQLTDREVQVLRLAATGISNRAIGAALHISPRTAEHHVQHIYAKIGVSTRAGTALYAMEHGLYRTDG